MQRVCHCLLFMLFSFERVQSMMCGSKLPVKISVNFLVALLQPLRALRIRFYGDLFSARNVQCSRRIREYSTAHPR
jgi:hypothetical protein